MIKLDNDRLHVFHEGRKRRTFVGELKYIADKNTYEFTYDKKYAHAKNAIPLSPELSLFKLKHISKKGELFSSFLDRIPDKHNPAYEDYCRSQNISPKEKNPIILLGTIGRRGPSSFVFEPVYIDEFSPEDVTSFRKKLNITQHDFAQAFDISKPTLQRIEAGETHDSGTLKRIQILIQFPDVALWQLKLSGGKVHKDVLEKMSQHFKKKAIP